MDVGLALEEVLNTCKEMKYSAPGIDGIPYSAYHKLWNLAGQLNINIWKYSIEKGELSREQLLSTIIFWKRR
jgi:hypothetical protein